MDDEAALALIADFETTLVESRRLWEYSIDGGHGRPDDSVWAQFEANLDLQLLPMQRIAREVEAGLAPQLARSGMGGWPWDGSLRATRQLAGLLRSRERLSRILGPTGPQLDAARLHPWVWSAAAPLWDNGHYRSAVQTAATVLDNHLQAKLDRYDASGSDLVTQAFNEADPQPSESRLRLSRFPAGSPRFIDAHQGAMFFGKGCMMAIRNIVTHLPNELDEQVGLEQLAALSVLARWIDEAEVESA